MIAPQIMRHIPETRVKHRRLGRHVRHDPQSRDYAFDTSGITVTSARHPFGIGTLDQGNIGSCTGNAAVGCLSTDPYYEGVKPLLPAGLDEIEAVRLYSAATQLDNARGTYPPTDTGSDGLSVAKAAQQAGLISGYSHTFTTDDCLKALSTSAVIIGINWYDGFDNVDTAGRVKVTGTVRGGHEVCLDEIDADNQLVWLHNSWGPSWGVGGHACLSWDDLDRLLSEQGDCTVFTPLTAPTPAPVADADAVFAAALHTRLDAHPYYYKPIWEAAAAWLAAKNL